MYQKQNETNMNETTQSPEDQSYDEEYAKIMAEIERSRRETEELLKRSEEALAESRKLRKILERKMRTFLTEFPGGEFYAGNFFTVVMHLEFMEIIFRIDADDEKEEPFGYGHVYLLVTDDDEVLLVTNWTNFFRHLTELKDEQMFIKMHERCSPKFYAVMTERNPEAFRVIRLPHLEVIGLGKTVKVEINKLRFPMALPYQPEVIDTAIEVLNRSLDVYWDIYDHSPFKLWRERTEELWENWN